MNKEKKLLQDLYNSFTNGDFIGMGNCYHENIKFQDPAFGILKGKEVIRMWEMLLSRKESKLQISYQIIDVNEHSGRVKWTANYYFGPSKRKVINHVNANFEFKDGKIIKHTDLFSVWKWSAQALGPIGYLLGWTGFMRNKIQQKANAQLTKFINSN